MNIYIYIYNYYYYYIFNLLLHNIIYLICKNDANKKNYIKIENYMNKSCRIFLLLDWFIE